MLTISGLTRALAEEVGKVDIRVNVIIPGYIETDMTAGMFIHNTSSIPEGLVPLLPFDAQMILIYIRSHDA